jgi:hypothetical protein
MVYVSGVGANARDLEYSSHLCERDFRFSLGVDPRWFSRILFQLVFPKGTIVSKTVIFGDDPMVRVIRVQGDVVADCKCFLGCHAIPLA